MEDLQCWEGLGATIYEGLQPRAQERCAIRTRLQYSGLTLSDTDKTRFDTLAL